MPVPKILVVEDEPAISELIITTLEFADFEAVAAFDVPSAHAAVIDENPDLILLDWMLPNGQSGIDLARRLKKDDSTANIPIIMLTAKGEEDNKVYGLDAGADDYITKPFSTRELVSRIKAVLRRTGSINEKPVGAGKLTIEPASQRVMVGNQEITMSSTEYRLLYFFMTHIDRVYTRAQILDQVWGGNVYIDERTVDVHIRRLRKVLEPFGVSGFIQTVRGTGYRFSEK
ncbi:phosphate regulon transcriptional regulatory protein PhoB [Moraxella caviae]|uniref:Phosphate regulon transcriptional regulatory protein PhoB n=1 Tax=Moraxella caviae TaxID=34060 RepID=A0A1T0AAY9_9GAMM|nr:phosphate regulon transcriptional regulator PhoB [Moraxella caviae]OOR92892.1 phosphate regulon transcriptional regulatory protein PhoB [Moraxella caviae]STZ10369.1 Phosphate regulon transcriptional regulatory protein phoB [Moraxella caviae]VEW12588.1 Phosphate regulon transcriptional regulatory protein phoB [Moraxella caviae]